MRHRVTVKVRVNAGTGWPTILSKEEEEETVETCQVFAEWEFGLQKDDIKSVVEQFYQLSKRKTLSKLEY